MLKERFGFITLGQAGGNVGRALERKGFNVLYMNTSKEDLEVSAGTKKYHIHGGEGCNKNRLKAKQLIIDDFENILGEIDKNFSGVDYLYIVGASSGGTGSGSIPMLTDLLINEANKNVGTIVILPNIKESIKANLNAYECLNELNEIEGMMGTFFLDNNKHDNILEINDKFVGAFAQFIDIPSKYKSSTGNIDVSEVIETLSAPGMNIVVSGNKQEVVDKLTSGVFAPREDDKVVKYISMLETPELTLDDIKFVVGEPFDTFKTYYKGLSVCCVSGLNYPLKRFEEIYNKVSEHSDIVKTNVNSNKKAAFGKTFDFLDKVDVVKKEVKETKTNSRKSIMDKYLK